MDKRSFAHSFTHTDDGFSLLETLFALVIMSLASLALFQSTGVMLQLSERAVKAGERTLNDSLDRRALGHLIDGLIPAWPENKDSVFTANAHRVSGLSTGALSIISERPVHFTLTLDSKTNSLIYRAGATDALTAKHGKDGWVLIDRMPDGARFEFMGVDQNWHSVWPPKIEPTRGFFDDAQYIGKAPLPIAVKLVSGDGQVIWTGRVARAPRLPNRLDAKVGI